MSRLRLLNDNLVFEELNIEKLYQSDNSGTPTAFDAKFKEVKENALKPPSDEEIGASPADNTPPEEPETPEPAVTPEDDPVPDDSESDDKPKDDSPTDEEPEENKDSDVHDLVKSPNSGDKKDDSGSEGSVAMESILESHYLALESLNDPRQKWERLSLEAILDDDHLEQYFNTAKDVVTGTAEVAMNGAKYLKELGIEYGPTIMKHVSEGVITAVEKTAKALVVGYEKIKAYIKKRQESYTAFKSKVAKLKAVVEQLKKDVDKTNAFDNNTQYKDADVIRNLKIGNTTDFRTTVEKAAGFLEAYFAKLGTNVSNSVKTTEYMLRTAGKNTISKPISLMHEDVMFQGMNKKVLEGYEPTSEHCESFVFDVGLPGDVAFVAFVPKKGLKSMEEVKDAYEKSSMFLGFTEEVKVNVEFTNFGDLEYVETFVNALDKICDVGIKHCKIFESIAEKRDELEKSLKPYMKVIADAKEKISVADSMAEHVSLKVAFLDKTYLAGAFVLHDYMVRLLTSSLDYCKSNLDAIE